MNTTITVEKNFKKVVCGIITPFRDVSGNVKYDAVRVVDDQQFTFFDYGAAELWMKLGGWLHG